MSNQPLGIPETLHPYQLVIAGYSGAGKTTLIERCIEKFSAQFKVGYFKHDAHRFQMDYAGKDTFRAQKAGAKTILINSSEGINIYFSEPTIQQFTLGTALNNSDFILVEGYKNSPWEKFLILDENGLAYHEYLEGKWQNVVALVYTEKFPGTLPQNIPCFERNQIEEIAQWMLGYLKTKIPPVYGLILMGGKSTRMGTDKFQLAYQNAPQYQECLKLLQPHCTDIYFSVRENQNLPHEINANQFIVDKFLDVGPLGGILTALKDFPRRAFLILAIDLPLLSNQTLQYLVENRNPYRHATVYRNPKNDYLEPLCTLYEPKFYQGALIALANQVKCPRKILGSLSIQQLRPPNPDHLDNANTLEDFKTLKQKLMS